MQILKVDAIDSTNTFLRELVRTTSPKEALCVVANSQSQGRGQMGTRWLSNAGENLICSIFIPLDSLALQDQFYLAKAASLALCDTLQELRLSQIAIKWPNDILSEKKKICGILIDNCVTNGSLVGAIVGIGLNVNQLNFPGLPQATSIKILSARHYALNAVLEIVLNNIENRFQCFAPQSLIKLKFAYETLLFRKNKASTFSSCDGQLFTAIIKEVTRTGMLSLLLEDNKIKTYDLKELKMHY